MKKTLNVDKKGNVTIDGTLVLESQMTTEFFDNLFKEALSDNVDFNIDETAPISKIFIEIRNNSLKNSDFRNKYEKTIKSLKEYTEKEIVSAKEIEALNNK